MRQALATLSEPCYVACLGAPELRSELQDSDRLQGQFALAKGFGLASNYRRKVVM